MDESHALPLFSNPAPSVLFTTQSAAKLILLHLDVTFQMIPKAMSILHQLCRVGQIPCQIRRRVFVDAFLCLKQD